MNNIFFIYLIFQQVCPGVGPNGHRGHLAVPNASNIEDVLAPILNPPKEVNIAMVSISRPKTVPMDFVKVNWAVLNVWLSGPRIRGFVYWGL